MTARPSRRTRIVCISDTHNCTVKLPAGDVLIHAGDLTNQGSYSELSKTVRWLEEEADFEAKIVVAGNHDITLDPDFYSQHGLYFHNQTPQDPPSCLSLLTASPSITYLNHTAAHIRLRSPTGPHTELTVFGSPYSPRHGLWAFAYDAPKTHPSPAASSSSDLTSLWGRIPLDADVVVTHTPPRTHCDEMDGKGARGCEALRRALWRVRPRVAVCGHVHDGRGAERVVWDLESRNVSFAEKGVARWQDPGQGNKKLSLVDLTGKKSPSLANDGSHPGRPPSLPSSATRAVSPHYQMEASRASPVTFTSSTSVEQPGASAGQGGYANSARCDHEALAGRIGRRETCVVNAAIMKSRYPHVGGKLFNKPIVVDVDLPVWEE